MKVNRFMGPVQTQYKSTYVDQFVPLPFELMQKKAEKQQKDFDLKKEFGTKLLSEMENKVDIKDLDVQRSEIGGLHTQVNDALEMANGDWSQLGNLLTNVKTDWERYKNTGAGYLAHMNKEAIDANLKLANESNMDAEDIRDLEELGVGGYRASEGAIGGQSYKSVPIYENPEDLGKEVLAHMNSLKDGSIGKTLANSSYTNKDGNLIIEDTSSSSEGVTLARVKAAARGGVFANQQWQNKMKWQYDTKKQLGKLPEGIDNIVDYKEYAFTEMMKESLGYSSAAIAHQTDKVDKKLKVTQTKKGELQDEYDFNQQFALDLTGEYNAIKNTSDLKELANAGGNSVNVLNNQTSKSLNGGSQLMAKKLNKNLNEMNDAMVKSGFGFKTDDGYDISDGQRIDFFNALLDPDFNSSALTKRGAKLDELREIAVGALKTVEHNELIKLQGLKAFVGKDYTRDQYDMFEATTKNRIKGARHARSVATDPNSTDKEKEEAYEMIKILNNPNMAESYEKFKTTFKESPNYSIWDIYWDVPLVGDSPGKNKKAKLEGNEDDYLASVHKSYELLNSQELAIEISENADQKFNSSIKQKWTTSLPIVNPQSGEVDPVLSRNHANAVNYQLKEVKDKILKTKVTRSIGNGTETIPLEEALYADATEAAGEEATASDINKIYEGYISEITNKGGGPAKQTTTPFTFSTTDEDVYVYRGYEINTDGSLTLDVNVNTPIATKSISEVFIGNQGSFFYRLFREKPASLFKHIYSRCRQNLTQSDL